MADGTGNAHYETQAATTVTVWDPLVRLFHWSLVGLFAFAFITGEDLPGPHETAGYIVAGLVAFRLVWGVAGSRYARFSNFIYNPATVISFLRDTAAMKARRYLGHNPAGGAMVIALLAVLAVLSLSGWMSTMDAYKNARWLKELHEISAFAALGLIGLHILGVLIASLEHGENLIRAMVTGRKRAPGPDDIA